jgi:hypothetical protein
MRRSVTALALMALVGGLVLVPTPALAQRGNGERLMGAARPELRQLRERADLRFRIIEAPNGFILVPRSGSSTARTIDLNDGRVLVDGLPVTGRELRDRLGDDADLVMQLSFLDAAGRQAFLAASQAPAPGPQAPAALPAPEAAAPPEAPSAPGPASTRDGWTETARTRHGGARVRVGDDVTVAVDETVGDDVVVIFGSAVVDGGVEGDVVAVGGSVKLGPKAHVSGAVTSVGGGVERAPGAVVEREINEVRFASPRLGRLVPSRPLRQWHWFGDSFRNPFGGTSALIAMLVRMGLIGLFAALIVAAAPGPVTRIADRASAEPWRAGLVGLAAQILFVPLLVLTVVILSISIIGIPLLLLVPFALLVVAIAFLMGFTGAGCATGQWIGRRAGSGVTGLLASLVVGLAIIWALTVVARFVGLAGLPVRVVLGVVLLLGFLVEYVAWTVGLGAVVLTRFGRRPVASRAPDPVL